ncbi:Hypp2463 [Branchiostoma lanceolatum]|uniref:Hypp2463 protein n=1 Tax=Branchiostoma lanceolatum TaxID=7740 RepID=A0A8J9ZTR1_BRALA|nr:Hypp2463 [Branchiostoma lanceolatum]
MKVHPRDMGAKSSKTDTAADFTDLQTLRRENETLKQKLSELQQDVKDWQDKYTDANERAQRVETRVRELESKYEQTEGVAAENGDVRRNSKQEMPQYLEKVKLVAQMKIKMKQHRQLLQETNVRNGSVASTDSRRPRTNSHSNGKVKQVRVWPAPKVVKSRGNGASKTYPAANLRTQEENKPRWMY